ncbi:MAG: response regulator [Blastocatellia bacterium]|nr:response regulator [Blastocatellia bacterium]
MNKKPLKVLVLEDEAYRREMIEPLLEEQKIYWAKDSTEALEMLDIVKFDLILLDHDLANHSCGCAVATRLANKSCLNYGTKIVVHSINTSGIKRMMRLLKNIPIRIPVFSLPESLPEVISSLTLSPSA